MKDKLRKMYEKSTSYDILKLDRDKEILQTEIKLLDSLQYVQAYTGSLNQLIQKSYVNYADITQLLNMKRKQLQTISINETYINDSFTMKQLIKAVNNWSMCRIDEEDILKFLNK